MLLYLLLLGVPGQLQLTDTPYPHGRKPRTPFLERCDKLGMIESYLFMNRLGRAKDFAKLKEIYESDICNADYATSVYAREMDEDKVVAFCCQFELGSSHWANAFWALSQHRKKAVIGYIKQLAQSRDINVRVNCYLVCENAGWGDLLEEAKGDVRCTLRLMGFGVRPGQTIGTVAEDYVKKYSKKRGKSGN